MARRGRVTSLLWRGFPFHDPRATRQRRGGKGHGGTRSLRWVIVVDRGNLLGRGLFWLLKVHVFTLTYGVRRRQLAIVFDGQAAVESRRRSSDGHHALNEARSKHPPALQRP